MSNWEGLPPIFLVGQLTMTVDHIFPGSSSYFR